MKTALIIGGTSTIGSALAAHLSTKNVTVFTTSRKAGSTVTLDLSASPETWPELPHADVTYLCAAMAKLETCENNPGETYFINVTCMQQLAEKLGDSHIVFLSSNQVFDGLRDYPKTTDRPNPMNKYGKQKLAFEDWLLAQQSSAAVLRLTKVMSGPLPILVQWKKSLTANEKIQAFDDLAFAPIPLESVLQALTRIGEEKMQGIFHLSGRRDISYYKIAQLLAEKLGVHARLVAPASAKHKGILPQFLPRHGTLQTSFPEIFIPEPEQIIIGNTDEGT